MPTPSPFSKRLANIAQEQHTKFQFTNEADPALCKQIRKWTQDIRFPFTSCTTVPWSAVFVSWCIKQAGATASEFRFAMAHSEFVHQAIQNADNNAGVFQGVDINVHRPNVSDIIHHNRGGNTFTFDFARNNVSYLSHSVIVLEIGQDTKGSFAFCVGGNESDSIRRTVIRLDNDGFIKQRTGNPFFCVIKDLK